MDSTITKAAVFCWCALLLPLVASAQDARNDMPQSHLSGDFWKLDAVIWGDGRKAPPPDPQHIPHGFRSDFAIQAPQAGWYELYLVGSGAGFAHDVFVDGALIWRFARTDAADKAGNLWLAAGKHTLRIHRLGRVGFPMRAFERFELRPGGARPEASIAANKTQVDVMRVGEPLHIEITAGGTGAAATYQLLRTSLLHDEQAAEPVATVEFPAGDAPLTRTVEIPCPQEGAFRLSARVGDRTLTNAEFKIGSYAVVDVANVAVGSGEKELVYDIDCVAQTVNGQPVPADTFVECNGPTRITESKTGRYRESHDGTPPYAPLPGTSSLEPLSYSGFSYRLNIQQVHTPYMVEVEFPDDTRRSVTVTLNSLNEKTGGFLRDQGYSGKSYETGGMFPLTGKMRMHRAIIWPRSQSLLVGLLSQSLGHRAAATRIRVYRFIDGRLPTAQTSQAGGRAFVHWYEETNSWRHLVHVTDLPSGSSRTSSGSIAGRNWRASTAPTASAPRAWVTRKCSSAPRRSTACCLRITTPAA